MEDRSRLVKMVIRNIGCVGPEGLTLTLDDILCLVGPNNSGKSTILRAYELAAGKSAFREDDLCMRSGNEPASVELWIHIPADTPNIAEKWKTKEGAYLLVRSRWEWSRESGFRQVRTTWDPEANDWSLKTNVSGLDEVFESRLPKPLRIGTLQDPQREHAELLALVLQPIADRLLQLQRESGSEIKNALDSLIAATKKPLEEERAAVSTLKEDLQRSHSQIFPTLTVDLDLDFGTIEFNLKEQLLKNSGVTFKEWDDEVKWNQQGTGSQRALFWALLQVRSKLQTSADIAKGKAKQKADLNKQIEKLKKEMETAKTEKTKNAKQEELKKLGEEVDSIAVHESKDELGKESVTWPLPGYMLLIDEPEVGLHPAAIRAASNYLYALGEDPAWQVMLSTHAPSFIDPVQDHTTIVRLSRNQANPSPNTYRSDDAAFSISDRENLKMLNRFDYSLAEMFFGQYPILIEGDTEYAAFEWWMSCDPTSFAPTTRPVLVRARGKYTLSLIIRMLRHFKVNFAVLHDSDTPYNKNGNPNSAWKANETILEEIERARESGLRVVHRISIPTFELVHLPLAKDKSDHVIFPSDKDKPWEMVNALKEHEDTRESVKALLTELVSPFAIEEPYPGELRIELRAAVEEWAAQNSAGDPRFFKDGPGQPSLPEAQS